MPHFDDQSRRGLNLEENRLETPSMVGYRRGLSSSGVIGRRLGSTYSLDSNLPRAMDRALRQLDRRVAGGK